MSYIQQLNEVLDSPCYSKALKEVLRAFDKRDCVDALRDANALAAICMLRVNDVENEARDLRSVFDNVPFANEVTA
jgi:hypothetical protein